MPKCKNCHAQISRLDKEICPFCGTLKPLEGQNNQTEDFTKAFDPIKYNLSDVKRKSKVVAAILAITLGVFGAHMYYLNRKKYGFIILGVTFSLVALVGCLLFFTNAMPNALAFLIPYFVMEVLMIASGITILVRHDLTDGNGEFLK